MSQNPKAGRVIYDNPSTPPQQSLHWQRVHNASGNDVDGGDVKKGKVEKGDDRPSDSSNGDGCGDDAGLVHSHEDLMEAFQRDIDSLSVDNEHDEENTTQANSNASRSPSKSDSDSNQTKSANKENYLKLAIWSCIIGYCEALATHKDSSRRFSLFPIPIRSLRRLVHREFLPIIQQYASGPSSHAKNCVENSNSDNSSCSIPSTHRKKVQSIANTIWKRAQNKKSTNMQDELHANSLYVCLCGEVDGKSLDCFGAALLVVVGMNLLGFRSCLTLSEDHAYESHWEDLEEVNTGSEDVQGISNDKMARRQRKRATCEVAIPGNTKMAQSKRGKGVSETFAQIHESSHNHKRNNLSVEKSWLYMANNPVICDTAGMAMAAMVGNINCDVDKQKNSNSKNGNGSKIQVVSGALYKIKRDMLWILHEAGYMDKFPFGLIELGECEEHLSSKKGMEWVDVAELLRANGVAGFNEMGDGRSWDSDRAPNFNEGESMVLWNEKLFLDAISVSKKCYGDAQAYPYLYAGHYHKDAGRDGADQEYRLVESLRLYSEASRVASAYHYDSKDCMQLMKHMTTVSSLIFRDILLFPTTGDEEAVKEARVWKCRDNAIAAATWLVGFFDSLLFWEEQEENKFVEILGMQHKHSFGRLVQLFPFDVRLEAMAHIHSQETPKSSLFVITDKHLTYFRKPRSKRLSRDSLLVVALTKKKVVLRELELALPSTGNARQRKRTRR